MKKLFSYLLISSMVVLSSCTNYDDQFDDLNAQINTLKTQIEGFSSVSTGLTSLQSTVALLKAAVDALPKTATDVSGLATSIDVASLSTALSSLADTVAGLKTQLDGAATQSDIDTLTAALATAQSDLTDLLAQNKVYSDAVSITSVATLEFAEALGDKLTIVNNTVTIEQKADMDAARLQAVMSKMTAVTMKVKYTATATGISTYASFDNLTSAGDFELDQDAPVSAPKLANVADLNIHNNTKVTSVSLPALVAYTTLANSTFAKATSLDLKSLKRLVATTTFTTDSGTADFSSLITKTDATKPAENGFDLTVSGATVVTAPLVTGGIMTFTDALDVSLPVWEGETGSAFAKAKKVVLPKITGDVDVDLSSWAPRATYFHMIGAEYNDASDSTDASKFPDFTLGVNGNTRLETLILDGDILSVNVTGAADLTSYTHTGSSQAVTFVNNDSMTSLTLGYDSTMNSGLLGVAKTNGTLEISDNSDLTSVTAPLLDDLSSFKLEDNIELTDISFAKLNSVGTATNAVVKIEDNKLVIDNVQRASDDGVVPVIALKYTSADIGPLKAFIDAAILKVGTTGSVLVSADDITQETSKLGVVTADPGAVDDADHVLVNYNPAINQSDAFGGAAMVEEFTVSMTQNETLTVGNYVSTITHSASGDYYDLLTWQANATEKANLETAGVTVTVGKGQYTGMIDFAAASKLTATDYYEIAVAGQTFTGTDLGAAEGHTVLSLVNSLYTKFDTNAVISATKQFNMYTTTTGIVFSGTRKGSNANTWSIGNLAAYTNVSAMTPVTTVTGTVTAPKQIETEGYIRVTSKVKGTAGAITSTFSTGDSAKLTASGTHTGASSTGDDNAVVAPKNGTDSSVSDDALKAARKDHTLYLFAS